MKRRSRIQYTDAQMHRIGSCENAGRKANRFSKPPGCLTGIIRRFAESLLRPPDRHRPSLGNGSVCVRHTADLCMLRHWDEKSASVRPPSISAAPNSFSSDDATCRVCNPSRLGTCND